MRIILIIFFLGSLLIIQFLIILFDIAKVAVLLLIGSTNNHIFGNLIEHGQWVGLYLMGDSNRNIIYENSIIHCGSEDDSEGALFIWGSDDNIIYDNNIAFNLEKVYN